MCGSAMVCAAGSLCETSKKRVITGATTSDPYPSSRDASAFVAPPMSSLEPLPASGAVLTESVARLAIAHYKQSNRTAADLRSIAGMLGTSISTLERVVDVWLTEGCVRTPQQGKGERDDPRWIFAGPRGVCNLRYLEELWSGGSSDAHSSEVLQRYSEAGVGGEPSARSISRIASDRLIGPDRGDRPLVGCRDR